MPEQLPMKPELDLPLWNEHCKDKLHGKFLGDGEKKWRQRYHYQRTKLFPADADFTNKDIMESVTKEYAAGATKTASMLRWMVSKQVVKTEMLMPTNSLATVIANSGQATSMTTASSSSLLSHPRRNLKAAYLPLSWPHQLAWTTLMLICMIGWVTNGRIP
jgi:hypothetical protein